MIPPMAGYVVEEAEAWWIACERCGETLLVHGPHADVQAMTWATEHLKECAG